MRTVLSERHLMWAEYVGSSKLHSKEELEILRDLKLRNVICISDLYELYLMTKHWSRIKEEVKKRDGNSCVICKSVYNLHVDHMTYRGMGKEKLSDLQTLCLKCHAEKTSKVDLEAVTYKKIYGYNYLGGKQLFTFLRNKSGAVVQDGQRSI
jgi:hypothetical protein